MFTDPKKGWYALLNTEDITCKPCLVYIYVVIALQREKVKHPDDIYTTILLHNAILFYLEEQVSTLSKLPTRPL